MKRLLLTAALSSAGWAQSIEGVVRDSQGHTLAGAKVSLTSSADTRTTQTDHAGMFLFSGLRAGTYRLRSGETILGPFELGPQQAKKADLTVQRAGPQFFDEPKFTVSGVTDTTNRGGHGSDTVLRSSESLAHATASLDGEQDRSKDPLESVRQLQLDAERDPSEANLFRLGAELLVHSAPEPAAGVFLKGNRLFPASTRMLLGLAAAFYARGIYDHAAKRFFEAADINPKDPGPYLFLGKVRSPEITDLDGYFERMGRFVKFHPDNVLANYYYGACLWNRTKKKTEAKPWLEKAAQLDPSLGEAYLQLGILDSGDADPSMSIAAYRKAIAANPRMEEAHYRLAQAYRRSGDEKNALAEFAIHDRLLKEAAKQAERDRTEIQKFVIDLGP